MKIKGQSYSTPTVEVIFQRSEKEFIVFKMRGVPNMEEFESLVERPSPPMLQVPGKAPKAVVNDPGFLEALADYGKTHQDYLVVKTIGSSEGVEWDKVVENEPDTWEHWREELISLGLAHFEIEKLHLACMQVNGLAGQMEENRDAFLAFLADHLKAQESAKSSQPAENLSTESVEPAKE